MEDYIRETFASVKKSTNDKASTKILLLRKNYKISVLVQVLNLTIILSLSKNLKDNKIKFILIINDYIQENCKTIKTKKQLTNFV